MSMRTMILLATMLLGGAAAWCQTAAQLPKDQQAYEQFRAWMTRLPPDEQKAPNLKERYETYLKSRGVSEAEIAAQIKMIEDRGSAMEVALWNRILTAENPSFNVNPNAFLVEMAKGRKPGTALDVGMGQGRNAIWLAQQGWTVTGFDPAEQAVALAKQTAQKLGVRLTTQIAREEDYDFGDRKWDLILLSYVGVRGVEQKLQRALKPGGVVVVEAFHRDATKGRSIGPAVVFDTGELVTSFPELRVVRYEEPMTEADFGKQLMRVVRYCGERPQ